MRRTARGYIDATEAAYLQLILAGADARRKKVALQTFCKLSRADLRLRNPQGMTLTLRGLLYDGDLKVVRWALNALAFVPTPENIDPVLDTVARHRTDPDILASGIAALAATISEDDLRERLHSLDMPLEGAVLLAAAQKVSSLRNELARLRVNIDNAPIADLRLSAVLIGLDKAPENLFSISHKNEVIIGELNSHPDAIAAQYSIWALTESRSLGFSSLRISLGDAAGQRPNIRAYIYRLVAEDGSIARRSHDFLVEASDDADDEARESLARGLVNTFYDGLDELITSWVIDEPHDGVREYLLDHMSAQSQKVPAYAPFVAQAWREQAAESQGRARIETAARGTPLGNQLRKLRFIDENAQFLLGDKNVTNNTFTFNAPAQGAFSGSGAATTGDITADNRSQTAQASDLLGRAVTMLTEKGSSTDPEATKSVSEALKNPTRTTVEKALGWLKIAKESGKLAVAASKDLPGMIDQLHALLPHLPL